MSQFKRIIFILAFGLVFSLPMTGNVIAAPEYVGVEGCKMCHRDEFADWERSKHGRAFDLLSPNKRRSAKIRADLDPEKDYTTSIKCLKCHTTGYKKPGGFVNLETTPDRTGIGCEMCHGPGSEFRKIHKEKRTAFKRSEVKAAGQTYGSEDEKVCKQCHEHKDTPMQPSVDDKYKFVLADRLKQNRAFHKFYPLEGKH